MSPPHRCIVLQHASSEGPLRLAPLLEEAGLVVEVLALHQGAGVPRALPPEVPLIVMGGSMGVGDLGDAAHPYLAEEVALLRQQLAAGGPVLGICLGAQLLAHAAGARVQPNHRPGPDGPTRVYEVGWGAVDFLAPGEPALQGLAASEMMLHWHGDTFDLPAGAVHLASTPACAQQGFRIGPRGFGLQFHPEVDSTTLSSWLEGDAVYVAQACGPGGAEVIRAGIAQHFAAYRAASDRLLRNLIRCLVAR
jgi:GMP synthase (glutamine-hydrolysing)